jgi:hypothetical protein
MDTNQKFTDELARWGNLTAGHRMGDTEIATLIAYARDAKTAPKWAWGAFHNVLSGHAGWNKTAVEKEVKEARVSADLGCIPDCVETFISAFLIQRGYTLRYDGQFLRQGQPSDVNYVLADLKIWTHEHDRFKATFEAALHKWSADEKAAILRRAYEHVAHDPKIDPDMGELARYVRRVVAEADDPVIKARNYRAAEIAFQTFIWRVKNHMRGVWHHHAHLMPILHGPQEDGKTAAMKHLFEPVPEMVASVGFDILDDNSKSYMLSTMPILFFDEMAGTTKADIERLKALMTDSTKQLREIYQRAATRTLMFSTAGCTNKDTSGLIRDETGNRRFIQFESRYNDVRGGALADIDALKIWRSVNENQAVAPRYRDPETIEIIREIQAEQRQTSLVEDWIIEGTDIPFDRWMTATELFREHFREFVEETRPNEVRSWDNRKLGLELMRLTRWRHSAEKAYTIERKMMAGKAQYRLSRSNVMELCSPASRRFGELMVGIRAAAE